MQILEVTIGGESKKSDGNYGSDGRSAFVKIAVHPGDDVALVIARGRELVQQALDAPAAIAATPPAPGADEKRVLVLVGGTTRQDERAKILKNLGLTWSPGRSMWGATVPESEAARIEAEAQKIGLTSMRATPEA